MSKQNWFRTNHSTSRNAIQTQLGFEVLEDRRLLSTYAIEQLTFTGASSYQVEPSISDDGTRIAFVSNADLEGTGRNAEHNAEIFLYDALTGFFRQITDSAEGSDGTNIEISGDGNRIVFSSRVNYTGNNSENNREIFVYDVDANEMTQITNNNFLLSFQPSVSYDGLKVAYQLRNLDFDFGSIYLYDATGVVPTYQLILIGGENPSLSSQGERIAFESTRNLGENPDSNREIFLFDVPSSTLTQVTKTQEADNTFPAISGDGESIAFASNADLAGVGQSEDQSLYLYSIESGLFTKASANPFVANVHISSDGSHVGYQIVRGALPILVNDVTTGAETFLVSSANLPSPFAKTPSFSINENGNRVALVWAFDPVDETPLENMELFVATKELPPTAGDDNAQVDEDGSLDISVLQNDIDLFGSPLNIAEFTPPGHGSANVNADGSIAYTPEDNFHGLDSFTYTVKNRFGLTAQATVSVTVVPVNDQIRIMAPGTVATDEDTLLVFSSDFGNAIRLQDIDIGNEFVEVTIQELGGHATLGDVTGIQGNQIDENTFYFVGTFSAVNNALEGLSFTPDENFNGSASLEIRVKDLSTAAHDPLGIDNHTIKIAVRSVNDAPSFALGSDQSVPEDAGPQSVAGFATAISPGPANESGQSLTFLITTDNDALFSVQPMIDPTTGTLTYTSAIDANGTANVTAQLMDDGGTAYSGVDTSLAQGFAVTVLSPTEQAGNLIENVRTLFEASLLDRGQSNALNFKLNQVQQKYAVDRTQVALNVLNAFTNQVQSLVQKGVLSTEHGQSLLDAAEDLQNSLETSTNAEAFDAAFAELGAVGMFNWI